jgi:hypothetical protein
MKGHTEYVQLIQDFDYMPRDTKVTVLLGPNYPVLYSSTFTLNPVCLQCL